MGKTILVPKSIYVLQICVKFLSFVPYPLDCFSFYLCYFQILPNQVLIRCCSCHKYFSFEQFTLLILFKIFYCYYWGIKVLQETLENSKREITSALLTRYPHLLRKYMSDKAKISPLVDMMVLLKLEMYSFKRQEKVSS